MDPITVTQVCATADLEQCPVGFLFRGRNPDRSIEDRYFAGLEAPLNHPSWQPETYFHVIQAEEGKVLEHRMKGEGTIITRDRDLTDCRVEARVRQFVPGAWPNMDDEYCTVARNGLVWRMQDLRRYYQLYLEGFDRVVLACRHDYDRRVLAERVFPLDPTRYHHLVAEADGDRIRCWCDGLLLADTRDATYAAGAAGLRVNSICRLRDFRVATWDQGRQSYRKRLDARSRELTEARAGVPAPVLWRALDLPRAGRPQFIRPIDGGECRLLLQSTGEGYRGLGLYDLEGRQLWETPATAAPPGALKLADMDGDGIKEIVSFFDGGLAVHRSTTGELLAFGPLPPPSPFDQNRERATIHQLYPAALRRPGLYDSVVIFDQLGSAGGWTLWVLDADLGIRWSRTVELPPMGHNIFIHDVNRDGREEILAGYHCYTGDGDLLWRVEEARYWDIVHGARHPDSVVAGELWPGTMRAAYAGGGEGFVLVDATCGQVLAHRRIGHAQGIGAARFCRNLPGHQVLVGTRHENYGILCFFDGEGNPVGRFQPDYLSQGGPPANWTGDGAEFVLLTGCPGSLGLWDVRGRRIVDMSTLDALRPLPADWRTLSVTLPCDVVGDPRDELAVLIGQRLWIYTQDQPCSQDRIYAPVRNDRIAGPVTSFERWLPNR